jgi:hypothetical protein
MMSARDEVLTYGLIDWVAFERVHWYVAQENSGDALPVIQGKTLDLIRSLVSDGLFEVWDLKGEGGRFAAWDIPLDESIRSIRDVYVTNFADQNTWRWFCWLDLTEKGQQVAEVIAESAGYTTPAPTAEEVQGSFASHIYPGTKARRNHTEGIAVRVIEYTLACRDADTGTDVDPAERTYRLLTTIIDPGAAPAAELAELYTQRWEIETAFDELKTHQRGPGLVLRSKMPDGVIQEVYGYLCVHYAIRWLMHSAATDYGHDPDRLSFIRSLRAARRTTASHPGFSP